MSDHTSPSSGYVIESRLQLASALCEAAEIEHNLMCLYLYAMFSLKRSEAEGVSSSELEAIARWRRSITSVALEEMTHLTLVGNLMSSIGASAHFMRPNFPSSPGFYPANIVIELAPFDMSTLDHFIFLERPRSQEIADGATFKPAKQYTRVAPAGRLMPSSGDYQTVGALYESIRQAFEDLCSKSGEQLIFGGSKAQQIGPLDSPLPGLRLVTSKDVTGEGVLDKIADVVNRLIGSMYLFVGISTGIVAWLFLGNIVGFDKTPWPLLLTLLNLPQLSIMISLQVSANRAQAASDARAMADHATLVALHELAKKQVQILDGQNEVLDILRRAVVRGDPKGA